MQLEISSMVKTRTENRPQQLEIIILIFDIMALSDPCQDFYPADSQSGRLNAIS
jgi:hypothetical protein